MTVIGFMRAVMRHWGTLGGVSVDWVKRPSQDVYSITLTAGRAAITLDVPAAVMTPKQARAMPKYVGRSMRRDGVI